MVVGECDGECSRTGCSKTQSDKRFIKSFTNFNKTVKHIAHVRTLLK